MAQIIRQSLFIVSIFLFSNCGRKVVANTVDEYNQLDCIESLKYYSQSWRHDSIGSNGFRFLFSKTILSDCRLVGSEWAKISNLLGPPNRKWMESKNGMRYIYYLNGDKFGMGNYNLEVSVTDEKIVLFKLVLVDG